MNEISEIGARVKSERERLGLTQEEFGAHAGVTRLTQSKYESGASSLNIGYLSSIEELGANLRYILTGEMPVYVDAEKEFNDQAKLVGDIVVAVEAQIALTGKVIPPEKKGLLVAAIFRSCRFGKPIDTQHILDLLTLSS